MPQHGLLNKTSKFSVTIIGKILNFIFKLLLILVFWNHKVLRFVVASSVLFFLPITIFIQYKGYHSFKEGLC